MKHKKKQEFDEEGWELVTTEPDTPQQANGSDCGVFTSIFADYLSRDQVRRALFLETARLIRLILLSSRWRSRRRRWSSTVTAWRCM